MTLYICGSSALQYWTTARLDTPANLHLADVLGQPLAEATRFAPIRKLQPRATPNAEIKRLLAHELRSLKAPLHLLVPADSLRSPSAYRCCHTWSGQLRPRSFVQVLEDVYVSSPAFCFMQLCCKIDPIERIVLGNELCGVYLPSAFAPSGLRRCPPLTTPEELIRFAKRSPSAPGKHLATQAAQHVIGNSASPMETALEMLLCLPRTLGGHRIPKPHMNVRVNMARATQLDTDGDTCFCDLYWPKHHLGVEYDSALHHAGAGAHDAARRNRLTSAGIHVISVTSEQMHDPSLLDVVAHQIARHLGYRDRPRGSVVVWHKRMRSLRRQLLQPDAMVTPRLVICE